jgi:hypothetical protein
VTFGFSRTIASAEAELNIWPFIFRQCNGYKILDIAVRAFSSWGFALENNQRRFSETSKTREYL